MAYIPIPDNEIEPGQPGTSLLFHKLRDNPESVFRNESGNPGMDGAAIINSTVTAQKLLMSYSEFDFQGQNPSIYYYNIIPGGEYSTGFKVVGRGAGASLQLRMGENLLFNLVEYVFSAEVTEASAPSGARGDFVSSGTAGQNHWLFLIKDKITDRISRYYSSYHPSWGHGKVVDYPFLYYNPTDYDLFMIPLDESQYLPILYNTLPIVGGGYLTQALFDADTYEIDYFRGERSFFTSLDELYAVDYGTSGTWPTDPYPVTMSNSILGPPELIFIPIPQNSEINCVSLTEI